MTLRPPAAALLILSGLAACSTGDTVSAPVDNVTASAATDPAAPLERPLPDPTPVAPVEPDAPPLAPLPTAPVSALLAPATPSAEAAAVPKKLPLDSGVYVAEGISCANPPNAALRVYDGTGLSGSATKDCRTTVKSKSGDTYTTDNSCIDTYSSKRTVTALQVTIPDRGHVRVVRAEGTQNFRLCPANEVPTDLRKLAG